jgi:hypothetical protein
MYQLQEQALIKKAAKKVAEEVVEKPTGVVYEIKAPKKVVKRAAGRPKKAPAPILPFKKLSVTPDTNVFDLLAELPPIMVESYLLALSSRVIINLDAERIIRRKKKRKLAAFLLMAA